MLFGGSRQMSNGSINCSTCRMAMPPDEGGGMPQTIQTR